MIHISTAFIAIIATLYTSNLSAGNTNDLVNRERLRSERIIKEILKNNDDFTNYKKTSIQKMRDYQEIIENIKSKNLDDSKTKKDIKEAKEMREAIVFVSFSMPELSLKQIIQDAAHYKIPVVIRGLYKNSFRKTIEKMFELVKENNKGGLLINPKWFKEYEIKAVPAVVVGQRYAENIIGEKNEVRKGYKKNDVVYGNIPIKRALSIIAERGDASDVAKSILAKDNDRNGI